jgi:hydrogenase expression/formation protein HypC
MCLAIPGQIVALEEQETLLALIEVSGVRRRVNVGLLEGEVRVGDWVLIHVGFAIAKVDEREAHATLELLQQLGEHYDQELADLKGSAIE